MCFPATASFSAGAFLLGLGTLTLELEPERERFEPGAVFGRQAAAGDLGQARGSELSCS